MGLSKDLKFLSYLVNLPLCGTIRKMSYLTRDFTKSSTSSTDKLYDLSSKRPSCLIESSNAAKEQFMYSSSLILEKPAFLKQFLTVFRVTSAHANTIIYMTSMIETFWSSFLPSNASIIFWITFVLYFAFKEQALLGS